MATTNQATHHLNSNAQTSISGNYEANLARMKEDLANMFKSKLVIDVGRTRLYQRPYLIWVTGRHTGPVKRHLQLRVLATSAY